MPRLGEEMVLPYSYTVQFSTTGLEHPFRKSLLFEKVMFHRFAKIFASRFFFSVFDFDAGAKIHQNVVRSEVHSSMGQTDSV